MYKFKSPYDNLVKFITWGTIVILAAVLIVLAVAEPVPYWFKISMLAFFGILIYLTYACSPSGYEIKHDFLIINRKIKPVTIAFDKITEVKIDPRAASLKCLRLFGSGGLFGFFGTFYSGRLKVHKRYITSRKNSVLIVADKNYVISPEKPELFVQLLQERIKKG
ncbi:MAG TPA: PH domain-containing protein [candidate division Zixibacteria bacterium]|nr:PH domain-containing protein [candidate division Zixibacteria bacterium]